MKNINKRIFSYYTYLLDSSPFLSEKVRVLGSCINIFDFLTSVYEFKYCLFHLNENNDTKRSDVELNIRIGYIYAHVCE